MTWWRDGSCSIVKISQILKTRHNKRWKCIFYVKNIWISIKIPLIDVPKGPIDNKSALAKAMTWHRPALTGTNDDPAQWRICESPGLISLKIQTGKLWDELLFSDGIIRQQICRIYHDRVNFTIGTLLLKHLLYTILHWNATRMYWIFLFASTPAHSNLPPALRYVSGENMLLVW